MQKKFPAIYFLIITSIALGCRTARPLQSNDEKLTVTIIQVNDVYEIAPLEGGRSGGMARVAQLKKDELKKNPNTILVMAGDFLSPSVYNSLKHQGKRIRGAQMVDAMNAAGMDLAVPGNHEFDITEDEFQSRMNESAFDYVASNTFHNTARGVRPFAKIKGNDTIPVGETVIRKFTDADGTVATIGFIGITLPFNTAGYVSYTDPLSTAMKMYERIKDSCDAVVALTHQLLADDSILATRLPGLAVIIGGHEHDMRFLKVGNVTITKAHANAKSAYVIDLVIDKKNKVNTTGFRLNYIDSTLDMDPYTDSVVQHWMALAENNFAGIGFDAKQIVSADLPPLDGRESEIRRTQTNFTKIIVKAMEFGAPQADAVIVNSGSIRVDDILHSPVTEYDIIRSLPFGGSIVEVDMEGKLLVKILNTGNENRGIGGFLHFSEKLNKQDKWKLNGVPIDENKIYRVALTDFLLTGGEANMSFLTESNPSIIKKYPVSTSLDDARSDIRLAIIRYLRQKN